MTLTLPDGLQPDRPLLVTIVVRQLHSKRVFQGDGYSWSICGECRQAWPCRTEEVIAQALTVGNDDD